MDNLNIYIKPFGDEAYQVKYFDVKMELEYCSLKQGEKAAELWNVVAGVPGCSLEGGMKAEDEKGVLPLTMELEPGFAPGFEKRVWKTGRAADAVSYTHLYALSFGEVSEVPDGDQGAEEKERRHLRAGRRGFFHGYAVSGHL